MITHQQVQLWGGLAMAAVGAVVLIAIVLGIATGLGVRMFEICSGHAQFARKYRKGQRRRPRARSTMTIDQMLDGSEPVRPADYLSSPVLGKDSTQPMERVNDGRE